MNLGTSLQWVSGKMKDKTCLIDNDAEVSYSDLWKNIELLAKAFLEIGIKEGDRIVLFLPNCKEFIYAFYALSRINAVSVPLNNYLTSHELKKIFDDCSPRGIITTSFLYEKRISPVLEKNKLLVFTDEPGEKKNKTYSDAFSFKELLEMGGKGNLPKFGTSHKQIASINYTYRGEGKPLGAVLTHGNYHFGAIAYVRLTELMTAHRVLLITPMSHIFTLISCVIVSLLRGATIVIMKTFIPSHVFKNIEAHKIDFMIAVPTIYLSLLRNYDKTRFNIASLKYGITGGSYMTEDTHNEIKREMGIELFQGYGLTETVPVTCNPRYKNKPGSLGIPGHIMKIKIVDENGEKLPPGRRGEIAVGGPSIMKEYYNKNGENAKFLKRGWFYTGDWGWMDEDGYVYFDGWKKDIVKIGGNNVDLKEVKDTLVLFPGVKKMKLNVLPDELWGCRLDAEIYVDMEEEITEKAIKAFCGERLAVYKIPKKILVIRDKNK
jgi:long-chain acyl-CoA synthetase